MESCAPEKGPATVGDASVHRRSGMCQESTVNATTGNVISTMDLSAQVTVCATAGTATAGMAGLETPVKSGWERSTDASEDTL